MSRRTHDASLIWSPLHGPSGTWTQLSSTDTSIKLFPSWGPELDMFISSQGFCMSWTQAPYPRKCSLLLSGISSWVVPRAEGTTAGTLSPRQYMFFSISCKSPELHEYFKKAIWKESVSQTEKKQTKPELHHKINVRSLKLLWIVPTTNYF